VLLAMGDLGGDEGVILGALLACASEPGSVPAFARESAADADTQATSWPVALTVTLDGAPIEGASVGQAGATERWTTDADGVATVTFDPSIAGDRYLIAAHAEARVGGVELDTGAVEAAIELARFDAADNEGYAFADPGEDHDTSNSSQCVHCHVTIQGGWAASPHRTAASNARLHDLWQGTAASYDEATCQEEGGTWTDGTAPGTGDAAAICFVGRAARGGEAGACADCHAPAIDGALGGRDLLDATGVAYASGVSCDVCHKVESVDVTPDSPGVGGSLRLVRPSEEPPSMSMGDWYPLYFGPYDDVVNAFMSSVRRELFHEAELCGGCHESTQATAADLSRWPDGALPVHSTYSEWKAGPFADATPCQDCHMPPLPEAGNSADLYNVFDELEPGITAGWERAPGAVRGHNWYGPRQPDAGMLGLAASLDVEWALDGDEVAATVTVTNVGPGHALPTGEPSRAMLLSVGATCDGDELVPTGGEAVPGFGGWKARKLAGDDWTDWPTAEAGDVVRVVRWAGWWDYEGPGAFGDGRFSAEERGLRVEEVVGEVAPGDPPPDGDVAYLAAAGDQAGAPGFGFARVMVDADGEAMAPHFAAVDIASDNRLSPQQSWTTTHRFAVTCDDPVVTARLVHRDLATPEAARRGWTVTDTTMLEVTR
jgi:hypothetical protein